MTMVLDEPEKLVPYARMPTAHGDFDMTNLIDST